MVLKKGDIEMCNPLDPEIVDSLSLKKEKMIKCNETLCYFEHEGICLVDDMDLIGEVEIGIPDERCNVLSSK